MYIQVKLLKGFKEPLLYETSSDWDALLCLGSFVRVPLRTTTVLGYVEKIFQEKPPTPFSIKKAICIEKIPHDPHYFAYISKLSAYYQTEPNHFLKRLHHFLTQKNPIEIPFGLDEINKNNKNVILTAEQEHIVTFLGNALDAPAYIPTLLHGVTGSGKTEVYKKLIEKTIKNKKTVILLLPEVTLALQFMHILKAQLDSTIKIRSFHSAVNAREKKKIWAELLAENPLLLIGVHLPLLLPISNLGLIIIDEEHDTGYQEKKHPKINSKEAALLRAQIAAIPILLGSATPSIASLYNVTHKGWHFFQLKQRFSGIFPTIKIVPMIDKKERKNFWISTELAQAITQQLIKKEQTLIFLNRRGFSFFVQCKSCSFIFYCDSCSVSLTLHENNELICHYCGFSRQQPPACPACKSTELIKKGIGTQQIVAILQKMFPTARIARADHDSTVNKKTWHATVSAFHEGSLDILVGTQTITKGYHFPKVSLVGVLWADLNLHFPVYNATETTLQQLIQVAGRAGRSGLSGTVIVQTMADHQIFSYLDELSYLKFYHDEFENRKAVGYPPALRLAEIELKHHNEQALENESKAIARLCQHFILKNKLAITLLGPSKPPVSKLKNYHMRKIYLKGEAFAPLIQTFQALDQKNYSSMISFTPNPLN